MSSAPVTRHSRIRVFTGGATVIAALLGVSGCASDEQQPAHTAPIVTEQPTEPVASTPEFVVGGSAEDNLPYFTFQLETFASGADPVEGQPIVDVITESGFDRNAMQVSFDRTKTNLVSDFIFVSVQVGESCLLGQIATEDRSVSSIVEPAIGPEGNICIIGETRPIDW